MPLPSIALRPLVAKAEEGWRPEAGGLSSRLYAGKGHHAKAPRRKGSLVQHLGAFAPLVCQAKLGCSSKLKGTCHVNCLFGM